ncbi:hypothetical protein [Actinobacillus suis]|uniref:hypothetical protein n=1 Tax=Actinobacillus suis TaxID=716 RepID=UPI00211E5270|nr:hypothetical protein [Actinobacillus suis]MCQ9711963.1 hypothetical protein [Actinobacillus suis]
MIAQEFLSLSEASNFVKSKGLNLEEWDLLFLASKKEFKTFNSIYSIPRIDNSNPLYKINGLKGIFEQFIETQITYVLEQAQEIVKDNTNIEIMDYSNGYETGTIFKDKETGDKVLLLHNEYSGLNGIHYSCASIDFPVYDGMGKQFDIISGMVESRMLENISDKNFLNSKLFYNMLKKSLNNYYVVNTPLDHFYFKLKEIIFYPIGLKPYHITANELAKNNDLREIYDEENFSTIFYFRRKELENYIEKQTQNQPINNLSLDNALHLLAEVINAVKSKNKKWTQSAIIDEILMQRQEKPVEGLEKRTIEEYFSTANKKLKAK